MTDLTVPAARDLLPEWRLALSAERKSPKTIAVYLDFVTRYVAWAEAQDLPPMRRISLQTWITSILEAGRAPGTARLRQQAVRRYAAWLVAVGHLDVPPFQGMSSPKLDQPSSTRSPSTRSATSCALATRTLPAQPIGRGHCGTSATRR